MVAIADDAVNPPQKYVNSSRKTAAQKSRRFQFS
jgi:hypothetical protein